MFAIYPISDVTMDGAITLSKEVAMGSRRFKLLFSCMKHLQLQA